MATTPSAVPETSKRPANRKHPRSIAKIEAEKKDIEDAKKKAVQNANDAKAELDRELAQAKRNGDRDRKILAGAWLLREIEADQQLKARFEAALPSYLDRDDHRGLFGLPPLPMPSGDRVAVAVKKEDKDAAKALGCKWDGKTWYIPPGIDPGPVLQRWHRTDTTPA
jgi:hypothetical protein